MPRVIDYDILLPHLLARGFVSLYHNSGAFGFAPDAVAETVGWIGVEDPTIRDAARRFVRSVIAPYPQTLASLLQQAWTSHLRGDAWLMPKSHWHYELHFGNRELLESALPAIGIEVAPLRERNDGSAIAFSPDEAELLCETAERLLGGLGGSDFLVAFPEQRTVCTIHHHGQLWWQTCDGAIARVLSEHVEEMGCDREGMR